MDGCGPLQSLLKSPHPNSFYTRINILLLAVAYFRTPVRTLFRHRGLHTSNQCLLLEENLGFCLCRRLHESLGDNPDEMTIFLWLLNVNKYKNENIMIERIKILKVLGKH